MDNRTNQKLKSVCILSFTKIASDGRVLRQLEAFAPHYMLTVIGYGDAPPQWQTDNIRWVSLPQTVPISAVLKDCKRLRFGKLITRVRSEIRRLGLTTALYLGWIWQPLYDLGYRFYWGGNSVLHDALADYHDAYHANDWQSVPMMAAASARHDVPLVIDLHEYAPLQGNNQPGWWRHQRMISHVLRKYAPKASAITTVAPLLADKYLEEYGFHSTVIMNAPYEIEIEEQTFDPENIRLTHHGIAAAVRKPEVMIETIALCDNRYSLHLMLLHSAYLEHLHKLADELAPGRVFFHDAVPPQDIVRKISEFDVGFNFIPPTTYNYYYSLPNKFLESIVAGLAVCIGPSPSMQKMVEQYQLGVVAASFEPADLAAVLNQTTTSEWNRMRQAARNTATKLSAKNEMQKIIKIYQELMA